VKKGKKLSATAERALALIRSFGLSALNISTLEEKLNLPRYEIIAALRELTDCGFGSFRVGRRGYESRFEAYTSVIEDYFSSSSDGVGDLAPSDQEPATTTSAGNSSPVLMQTLHIMRTPPFSISVPGDLTPAEAAKIAKWLDVVACESH